MEPVLLERDEALTSLRAELDSAAGGAGRLVFVSGEAGVGKTALVQRLVASRTVDAPLLGVCDSLFTPRPLGPLLEVAESAGGELERLVHADVRPHELVAALLRELESRAPALLVLEDVHWADEATLDVVRLLGRRVEAVRALVLVTFRDDELARDHPLRLVVGELATSRATARIRLEPLSPEAVRRLGRVGTVCIYQASSPEAIRAHAERAGLPVDEIIAVADTVIVRPDPVPVAA